MTQLSSKLQATISVRSGQLETSEMYIDDNRIAACRIYISSDIMLFSKTRHDGSFWYWKLAYAFEN